jgi:hypothetical protein
MKLNNLFLHQYIYSGPYKTITNSLQKSKSKKLKSKTKGKKNIGKGKSKKNYSKVF